eukprot:3712737-Rhodomonas_salina.2
MNKRVHSHTSRPVFNGSRPVFNGSRLGVHDFAISTDASRPPIPSLTQSLVRRDCTDSDSGSGTHILAYQPQAAAERETLGLPLSW